MININLQYAKRLRENVNTRNWLLMRIDNRLFIFNVLEKTMVELNNSGMTQVLELYKTGKEPVKAADKIFFKTLFRSLCV